MADTASKVNNFPSAQACKTNYSMNLIWINQEKSGGNFIMHYSGKPGRLQKRNIEALFEQESRVIFLELDNIRNCTPNYTPEEQVTMVERQQSLQIRQASIKEEIQEKLAELKSSISPEMQEKEFVKTELLMPALEWAEINPNADINIWFDSVYAADNSLQNTQELLMELITERNLQDKISVGKIRFHDVREIEVVKSNPELFSYPIDLYFRIDLLKSVITLHEIEDKGKYSAIFTDTDTCDKRKLSETELFSQEYMAALEKNGGFLLAAEGARVENFFLQLINNPGMLEATRQAIINVNLARAQCALNIADPDRRKNCISNLQSCAVFAAQRNVFNYYKTLVTADGVRVRVDENFKPCGEGQWVDYNPSTHGYEMFGLLMSRIPTVGISSDGSSDYAYNPDGGPTDALFVKRYNVPKGRQDVGRYTSKVGGYHSYHSTYDFDNIPKKVVEVTFTPWPTKSAIPCQSEECSIERQSAARRVFKS
jgi:hypothetical protein